MPRKNTKITFNLTRLEAMRKAIGDKYVARVGILAGAGMHMESEDVTIGGKKYRKQTKTPSTLSNAEIGVIQEFGSETANIPPRSFLRMPIETKSAEIIRACSGKMITAAFEAGQFKKVFALLGIKAEEIVQDAFSTAGFGKWPANAKSTIMAKGSSAPLIDTSQLRRAITSDVMNKNDAR